MSLELGGARASPRLAAMFAAAVLAAVASTVDPIAQRVVALLGGLVVLGCVAVAVAAGAGAILTGIGGDTPTALAFAALFVVAVVLLVSLLARAQDEEAGLADLAPPPTARWRVDPEGIIVLACMAASVAGGEGAIVAVFYGHPLRAIGFSGLPAVAVGVLVLRRLHESDGGNRGSANRQMHDGRDGRDRWPGGGARGARRRGAPELRGDGRGPPRGGVSPSASAPTGEGRCARCDLGWAFGCDAIALPIAAGPFPPAFRIYPRRRLDRILIGAIPVP